MTLKRSTDTEVEEVLQQVELALRRIALTVTIVDVYLRVAHHIRMIHIEVVLLILHHSIEVVVVGHRQRHIVRIGLTQIGLRVECQEYLLVLIPVERSTVNRERCTIAVQLSIVLRCEQLPTAGQYLIKTRIYTRSFHTECGTRQYSRRYIQRTNLRSTALQLQVDVNHVQLVDQAYTFTLVIGFIVGVLIDNANHLLRRYILSIRLTRDVQGCSLCWLGALDCEELLVVGDYLGVIKCQIRDNRFLLSCSTAFR